MKQHFKWILPIMAVLALGLPFVGHAQNQQGVYTWVDKNGVRHYSDQPTNPKAVLVTVEASPAMSAPPAFTLPEPGSKGKAQAGPKTQPRETPAERAARCAKLRQEVQQLQSARRVEVTQNGKKQFYSGDNLVNFRKQMQKRMQAACMPSSQ